MIELSHKLIQPEKFITEKEGYKLFEDVGMIYELQLAGLELSSFEGREEEFLTRTAYFEQVGGRKSYHYFLSSVKGKGQIGRTNQYLTHWFYPYKGKYHGQMIKAILNFVAPYSDMKVLDPYNGSGTTLIEASTINLKGIGVEINPALCIIAQIKCDLLKFDDIEEFVKFVDKMNKEHILSFFLNRRRSRWKLSFKDLNTPAKELIGEMWDTSFDRNFINELPTNWKNTLFMVFVHSLSDYTYLKGTQKGKPLIQFFEDNLKEYIRTLSEIQSVIKLLNLSPSPQEIILGDVKNMPFNDESIDAIVTSPPYSIALDYVKNDIHLLEYLGINTIDLRSMMVGMRGDKRSKLELYSIDLKKSIAEMGRVVKRGGWVVLVLGDVVVNSKRTDFCQKIMEWRKELGFSEAFSIKRPILGGFARLRYEHLLFLRK